MGQTKRGSSNWTSHRLVPDFIFLFYKHCCSITKWRLSSRVCKCAARCRGLWQCGSSPAIFTPLILQFPPSATITKQHSVPPKSNTCNILLSAVSSAPYLSKLPHLSALQRYHSPRSPANSTLNTVAKDLAGEETTKGRTLPKAQHNLRPLSTSPTCRIPLPSQAVWASKAKQMTPRAPSTSSRRSMPR